MVEKGTSLGDTRGEGSFRAVQGPVEMLESQEWKERILGHNAEVFLHVDASSGEDRLLCLARMKTGKVI